MGLRGSRWANGPFAGPGATTRTHDFLPVRQNTLTHGPACTLTDSIRFELHRQGQRSIIQKAIENVSSFRAVAMPRATLSRDLLDDRISILLVVHYDAAQRQPDWVRSSC